MNPFDLTGRKAAVTGGNGGIGLGMARGLARAGADLAILGRNPEKTRAAAEAIASEFQVKAVPILADLGKATQCVSTAEQVAEALGGLDILINNAGINIRRPPQEMTEEQWRDVLEVNLTGVFLLTKAAYPFLKAGGKGKVILIGSMTSIFGSGFAPAYAATKGAVVQLAKSLALAWAADHIQVNAILPGWYDTDLTYKAREEIAGLHERVLARIPQGRWGKPEDIAGAAVWLASPASDYVTGVAIPIDGGYAAML